MSIHDYRNEPRNDGPTICPTCSGIFPDWTGFINHFDNDGCGEKFFKALGAHLKHIDYDSKCFFCNPSLWQQSSLGT